MKPGSAWLLWLAGIIFFSIGGAENAFGADVVVHDLICEYRVNPIGIDTRTPRLSWQLESSGLGQRQTAYRILVASSRDQLQRGRGDLWDSGRVNSDQSLHIRYAGQPLGARQQCFWKVKIWDKDGSASAWSPAARWELGLPAAADWSDASWIRLGNDTRSSPLTQRPLQLEKMSQPRMVEAFPAPLFRREFELRPGFTRARAYVCGVGYNEVYVNGRRSGDAVLDPGQTTYDVRALYVTHDLTAMLHPGRNAVGIMLGSGFFGQNHAFNVTWLANRQPALLAKIIVDYADGTAQTIVTDDSWKAETGPILYDNVYGGETYDARREWKGWNEPAFGDARWQTAVIIPAVTAQVTAQMIPPIRVQRTLPPKKVFPGTDGKWIFDLGQNIAGWARLRVHAPAGTKLTLKFAEALLPDGKTLNFVTTGKAATGLEQTDVYVSRGGGLEIWQPRFTYHGFRYVEVEGLPGKPQRDFLEGVLVRSDVPGRGSFECSDELLNRIYRTSLWTIEDNLHSTAEDCPHREKCGWLGDAHSVAETEIFNFDMAQFWTKYVDDIGTTLGRGGQTYWGQKATTGIPCNIAVGRRLCEEARPDWGAAYVLLPWYLYNYYGDTEVFARHYEHLRCWIEYVGNLREDGIVTRGYGDWCPPGENKSMECPPPLTSTALYYGTLRMMADFARLLGRNEDVTNYANLAETTRTAFNQKFFDEKNHSYGSQTANAVALRFSLSPDGRENAVARALAANVTEQHQGHAFVGIHGGRPLFTQLCEHGDAAVAFTALRQTNWPSYGYTLNQGFTTWPEVLGEMKAGEPSPRYSFNHPMQSGFAAWFHECLGGIQPAAPGFKSIVLKPHGFSQLTWVRAEHDSLYGPIKSEWHTGGGNFLWKISIPANTTATVFLPVQKADTIRVGRHLLARAAGVKFLRMENDCAVLAVDSGKYQFVTHLKIN